MQTFVFLDLAPFRAGECKNLCVFKDYQVVPYRPYDSEEIGFLQWVESYPSSILLPPQRLAPEGAHSNQKKC